MTLCELIQNAELTMFFGSGRGLGAVLLAVVVIVFALRPNRSEGLASAMKVLAASFSK